MAVGNTDYSFNAPTLAGPIAKLIINKPPNQINLK